MDEELLQLPILQLSTIVVAFDVVQIGNFKQAREFQIMMARNLEQHLFFLSRMIEIPFKSN